MSGLKTIKTAGVCEFSSDHAMEAQSVLTEAYLRAHPPNLNSSNHFQLDQVPVCDHRDTASIDSSLRMIIIIAVFYVLPKVYIYHKSYKWFPAPKR